MTTAGATEPVAAAAPARLERGAELLRVEDLSVHFPIRSRVMQRTMGTIRAVDGIDLTLAAGETLGLVGEIIEHDGRRSRVTGLPEQVRDPQLPPSCGQHDLHGDVKL